MVECTNCSIPPIDNIKNSVDLDKSSSVPHTISRADCFVQYESSGSFLIECKTSYIKRAVRQLEECVSYLFDNWDDFKRTEGLGSDTPFPNNFMLFMKNGIGNEKLRYEIDKKTKRLKIKKNGFQKVNNSGFIQVYTGKDVANMKSNQPHLHKFGVS